MRRKDAKSAKKTPNSSLRSLRLCGAFLFKRDLADIIPDHASRLVHGRRTIGSPASRWPTPHTVVFPFEIQNLKSEIPPWPNCLKPTTPLKLKPSRAKP